MNIPGHKGAPVKKIDCDILFTTVNEHETQALVQAFAQETGKPAKMLVVDDRTYQNLGEINGTTCYLAISEMGSGGPGATQQTIDKGIRALAPNAVIAVGIAFGAKKKQEIGDILLSKQVVLYEMQRRSKGNKIEARGDKAHASSRLISFFQNAAQVNWHGANVHPGLLLTGEKLIDDIEFRKELVALEPEAIGGEMEGAGLYVASLDHKMDWIIIKAICDRADGNKARNKTQRQKTAAKNAVDFVIHALKQAQFNGLQLEQATPSTTKKRTEILLVDFAESDIALASWLSRKLLLAGYKVWSKATSQLAGQDPKKTLDEIVKGNAFGVITILSEKALEDKEYFERRVRLSTMELTIIPVKAGPIDTSQLDSSTRNVHMADCSTGWGTCLGEILKILSDVDAPCSKPGSNAILQSRRKLIEAKPEILASNQYKVTQLPKTIKQYKSKVSLEAAEITELLEDWPAKQVSDVVFWSFLPPSSQIRTKYGLSAAGEKELADEEAFESETARRNAIIELCKKSIASHCISKGLTYCKSNEFVYFKYNFAALKFTPIEGKPTRVNPTGERNIKKAGVPIPYRYQQAPTFDIRMNKAGIWVLIRLRVRLTDAKDQLLKPQLAGSRRKHLCKNWWNEDWLKRSMAVMQFLAKDGQTIVVGGPTDDCLKINALPDTFEIPSSLNEDAIKKQAAEEEEEERDQILMVEREDEEADPDWNDGDEDDE